MKFHLPSSIGSNVHAPTLYPDDYVSWIIHMKDYIIGLDKGYEIWRSIMNGPFVHPKTGKAINTEEEMYDYIENNENIPA